MPVKIAFDPDMSAVRKAIDDLVRDAQNQRVTVNVSTPGFQPGAPGTTGGIPTATAILGGGGADRSLILANQSAANFYAQNPLFGGINSTSLPAGTGQATTLLNSGGPIPGQVYPAGTFAANGWNGIGGGGILPPGGGGGGAGGGGAGAVAGGGSPLFPTIFRGGYGRAFGMAILTRELLRTAQAQDRLKDESSLAGENQLGIYQAESQFRSSISSFPILGQLADIASYHIASAFGISAAGSQAVINQAEASDAQISVRRADFASRRDIRNSLELSGERQPFRRAITALEQREREENLSVYDRRDRLSASDEQAVTALKAERETTFGSRVPSFLGISRIKDIDALHAQDEADVRSLQANQAQGRANVIDPQLAAIRQTYQNQRDALFADENARLYIQGFQDQSDTGYYRLLSSHRSVDARRQQILDEGNVQALTALRNYEGFGTVLGIIGRTSARVGAFDTSILDERKYRSEGLDIERGGLEFQLDRRPAAGRAFTQARSAILEAQKLTEQDQDPSAASQVLGNAILQQQVLRNRLTNSVEGVSADPAYTNILAKDRGNNEDSEKYLQSIDANIKTLVDAQRANGGSAGVVGP